MPITIGIKTFMGMIIVMLSLVEHEKDVIASEHEFDEGEGEDQTLTFESHLIVVWIINPFMPNGISHLY